MPKNILLTLAAFLISVCAYAGGKNAHIYHKDWIDFNKNGVKDIYEDPSRDIDERVGDLLSRMTLEEKSCQLVTLYGFNRVLKDALPTPEWKNSLWKDGIANIDEMLNGVNASPEGLALAYPFHTHVEALHKVQKFFVEETRLGIPAEFSNEGIHGLTHPKTTPLPAPIALGSTWNRELIYRAGEIVGQEAVLLGYHSVYAPILDLARDQRWGRTLECYGEDPYLASELGINMVRGIQKNGVFSCLKHYAAYSVPKGGRDGNARTDPHITPRELHEIYLYPFGKVIRESHPMEVMSSYNDWNGEPVTGSHYFLTELLREKYGFDGYVVSDSDAVEFIYTKHKVAASAEEAAKRVLEAGMNVRTNFTVPETFAIPVRNAVESGILDIETVDSRVREVLRVKFLLGLFDNPYTGDGGMADLMAGADRHGDFVDEVQSQGIVLLKNAGDILPLDKETVGKVLVTGPLAAETNFMTSRYGPSGLNCISMLDGLRSCLGNDRVIYEKGCDVRDANWPESEIIHEPLSDAEKRGISDAVEAARGADVIIACLGEDENITGESRSRTSLDLPGRQQQLLEALYATGKPVVLVLVNGQPLTVNWADKYIPAILETWFPSYRGGEVVAKMLFGELNPSGKLPVTFPRTVGQIEYNFPFKKGSHNGTDWRTGPSRVEGALYPFGYGLSYTEFEYSSIKVGNPDPETGDIPVSVSVTNTGGCDGTEIVQLYVSDLVSSLTTYESRLCGFARLELKKGETGTAEFVIRRDDLKILDANMNPVLEPGEFEIRIGASSEDIRLKTVIRL